MHSRVEGARNESVTAQIVAEMRQIKAKYVILHV